MNTNQLPILLTSFVGREKETVDLLRLLEASRLVTLTGAGGCGKTRLALELAHRVENDHADGVLWLELVSVTDATLVPQTLAKALNISMQNENLLTDSIIKALHEKHTLVVLDNCEHLIKACASLAAKLLQETGISMLVTSREPLSVEGEVLYPLSPLSLPPVESDDVQNYDAVCLFVERAQAVVPAFALTDTNQEVIAKICRRLDGIPLAIELASARVNILSIEQIDERLDDRFALLTSSHLSDGHHRTLHTAIDWSYNLLPQQEQILLRRLAVFPSSCAIDSVEAICTSNDIQHEQLLDLLASLVNKSLVISDTLTRPQARYRMLETIREYAKEKLNEAGETEGLSNRHLAYFMEQAEEIAPKMRGKDQRLWLNQVESEHDNFRTALKHAIDGKNIEAGMRIASALTFFWNSHGYVFEGQRWLEQLLNEAQEDVSPAIHARCATQAAMLANILGDTSAAQKRGNEAIELCERAGEEGKPILPMALVALGSSTRSSGDLSGSLKQLTRAVELNRELDHKTDLALTLQIHALTAMDLEEYELAKTSLQEGLQLAQELKDTIRIAHICNYFGDVYRCEGKYDEALKWYEMSLANFNKAEAKRDSAGVTHNLAYTYWHLKEEQTAEAFFRKSLSMQQALKNVQGIAECLTGLSAILLKRGLAAETICLLVAVAIHGRESILQWPAERMEYNHIFEQAREKLSEGKFDEAQAEGRSLSLEQAQEFAFYLLDRSFAQTGKAKQNYGGLTRRELEVAGLIGSGKSNIEIAETLVLSKRTVESHVAHILTKLGFKNRPQIVRWAVENGLVAE